MPAVTSVLVVGGGAAGAAAAILLADGGVAVDLVDNKPDIAALGSGITLQGNALRVLRELGVWDEIVAVGYPFDTLGLRAPDPDGTLLVELTELRTGGADLPATFGMHRPELARILLDRAGRAGAKLRFATTFTSIVQDDYGVEVGFTDGSSGRYDLVIGADGVHSATREAVGIELETQPVGMGIWRVFTPRPATVTRTDLFYGGKSYIAGYCPTGPDSLYAYIVEAVQDRSTLTPDERLDVMVQLTRDYHGPWDDIRPLIVDSDAVNYARFESHLIEGPWHRGRVVVIGDAAHLCPPTLAQGAAQAFEDASVLAELLLAADRIDAELWARFSERRTERATAVVEASVQLTQWLLHPVESADVPGLMTTITELVSTPA